MRAKVCYPATRPRAGYGRMHAYFGYWNVAEGCGHAVSVDILTFLNGPWQSSLPIRRPTPFFDGGNALHIDGGFWGIVPNGTEPTLDASADCSMSMALAPWIQVRLPVQEVVRKLVLLGYLNQTVVNGAKLTGGIVNGVETWGRHWTTSDVRNRTVWLSKRA